MKVGSYAIVAALMLSGVQAKSDIMGGDYNILVNLTSIGSDTGASFAGPVVGASASNIDFTFEFTDNLLTLGIDFLTGSPSNVGGTTTFSFSNLVGDTITSFERSLSTPGSGVLDDVTPGFSTDSLFVQLVNQGGNDGDSFTYIYEINGGPAPVTAVPEPSSFAVFFIGGLAAWRIRRKRAA